jgi:hypothetical protein
MNTPTGTLLVFATNPDNVAQDGIGRNGTYTKHLLQYITQSELEVGMLLRKVRTAVKEETGGQQVPWENGSIEGEFYFTGMSSTPPVTLPASSPSTPNTSGGTPVALGTSPSQTSPIPTNPVSGGVTSPPVSQVASMTPPVGSLSHPSVTSSTPSFNGAWFSSQYNFGFRIEGKIGRATKSNSPKFAPGDIILNIDSLSENKFQGHQMYTDGNWYKVSGELLDAQTLKMRDDSSSSMHTMTRQPEGEQLQTRPVASMTLPSKQQKTIHDLSGCWQNDDTHDKVVNRVLSDSTVQGWGYMRDGKPYACGGEKAEIHIDASNRITSTRLECPEADERKSEGYFENDNVVHVVKTISKNGTERPQQIRYTRLRPDQCPRH